MRILLIQPPFWGVNSPSIGLSNLKASLVRSGIQAEILYSNLDFAKAIGWDLYEMIQHWLPVDLLYGDLVFASALQGSALLPKKVRDLVRWVTSRPPVVRNVPERFVEGYVDFAEAAVQFVQEFQRSSPWREFDLVGFTTTFSLVPALAMAKAIKQTENPPPVILGGSHCEGTFGEALMRHFPWFEFAARGEWEDQIVSLAEHLTCGQPSLHEIDGLLWRDGDVIREADKEIARIEKLDTLPVPDFQDWLSNIESLGWKDVQALRLPLETARGCWFGEKRRCVFCGLNGSVTKFRTKGVDRILADYTSLLGYNIPHFNVVDNVLDPGYFQTVIPRIHDLDRKAISFFEVRPTIDKEQLLALKGAGFYFLQPGIESLNTRLLKLMNKGTTELQNVRLLRWAAELGMPLFWNMLCGLPGEEAADYDRIVDLIPSLMHLYPPLSGCNQIHVDRFSPLFERHQGSIQPILPYYLALGLDAKGTEELAYHFEFVDGLRPLPETISALERLFTAVQTWQSVTGTAAFVCIERNGKLWLFDTRPGADHEETILEGARAKAYRLMDAGCERETLHTELGLPHDDLEVMLAEFLSQRWIACLDGKFLNLAVPMDEAVPKEIPASLMGSVAVTRYVHRMTVLWKSGKCLSKETINQD